jgi:hypothetical protein
MAKSILAQIKSAMCNNSGHQWSEWLLTQSVCTTTRICRRCGVEETQIIEHSWDEWILDDRVCSINRKCMHCGAEETQKTNHLWSDWNNIENQCVQIRMCTHCGFEERKEIAHDWGDAFINNRCIEAKKCKRCSVEVETNHMPQHIWGEWKYSEEHNCRIRECEHCHKIQEPLCVKHNWSGWELIPGKCIKEGVCLKCGKKRTIESHPWGEWVRDFKCQRTRTRKCTVCGIKETGESQNYVLEQHIWGDWQIKPRECVEVRLCTLCGAYDYSDKKNPHPDKNVFHDYQLIKSECIGTSKQGSGDDWGDTYKDVYKCKRCGDEMTSAHQESPGFT